MSFKGTLQNVQRLLRLFATSIATEVWCNALLDALAAHTVGDRPDRYEPRVKKGRPKPNRKMTKPRQDYRRHVA